MGGDHKCPLCSATFTRPQHVGRHLRAHTGDRPYECKECPLRFARSDLLSRHVNKAHRAPEDGGAPKKEGKKGRRKSTAGSDMNGDNGNDGPPLGRRPSVDQGPLTSSTPVQNGHAQLQASKLYPHHPLLSNNPPPPRPIPSWNPMETNGFAQPAYPAAASMSMQGSYPGLPPTYNNLFTATPMRQTGSEQGGLANNYLGRSPQMNPWAGYDFGFKKKACDQCNHSKVRCDFADPCARCSHRNIMCTYNKPSKSRSIVQAMPFGNRLGIFESSSNGSISSTSPQSQFTGSPLNKSPNALPISPHQRRQSLSNGPVAMPAWNSTYPPSAPMAGNPVMSQPMWTQSMSDLNAMVDPHLMAPPSAHPMPLLAQNGMPLDPYATHPAMPGAAHMMSSASYSNGISQGMSGSPSVTLAPTPALTNDSRSPSHVSETSDRRNSRGSQSLGGGLEPMTAIARPSIVTDQIMPMPVTYSPTSARNSIDMNLPTLTADGTMAWSAPGMSTIDPRMQFRNPASTDEDSSVPSSSRASLYLEPLAEGSLNALQARRFSTGAWANAFNNMSLQDANGNPTTVSVNALTDPYTAGQIAQTLSARRPTFPFMLQHSDGTASKIPSMADVKDLWKLFMSEPITGPTPSIEKSIPDLSAMVTPRPGMGHRTLSKRNSMPDLNSPTNSHNINNFFAHSGVTPRAVEAQSSYIPPHVPSELPPRPDASIRKWKEEINSRQAAFTMQPSLKLGGKVSSPSDTSMPPPTSMDYASLSGMPAMLNNRPLASVLQHNPALYQTLAPERAPSYGLGASYEDGIPTLKVNAASPGYTQPSIVTSKFTSNLSGPVITSLSNLGADATDSAMPNLAARPGNKRLASQTLVHEKRASFSLYDEGTAEEGDAEVSVLSGAMDPSNMSMWEGVGVGVPVQNGH